jgi:hypothetical protein
MSGQDRRPAGLDAGLPRHSDGGSSACSGLDHGAAGGRRGGRLRLLPLFVAVWEAACGRSRAGVAGLGVAVVAIIGLALLMRPDPSVSATAAGLLLALLAAVLHATYILLGRSGWGEAGAAIAAAPGCRQMLSPRPYPRRPRKARDPEGASCGTN